MPTYEYECDACGHSFEYLQSMLDKKLTKCPQCQKDTLHRLIGSGSGIIFKGSGFYETDYKKTPGSEKPKKSSETAPEACKACPKSESCDAAEK